MGFLEEGDGVLDVFDDIEQTDGIDALVPQVQIGEGGASDPIHPPCHRGATTVKGGFHEPGNDSGRGKGLGDVSIASSDVQHGSRDPVGPGDLDEIRVAMPEPEGGVLHLGASTTSIVWIADLRLHGGPVDAACVAFQGRSKLVFEVAWNARNHPGRNCSGNLASVPRRGTSGIEVE